MDYREELNSKENEFIEYQPIKIFCGTYNLNGCEPTEHLAPWLCPNANANEIDIYAIGFQELVGLNAISYMLKSDWRAKQEKLIDAIEQAINNTTQNYELVEKIRMYGIVLFIYVRKSLAETIVNDVLSDQVPTGIMGQMGNKGSVGISMLVNETRICFICSHFAAHTDRVEKRNADYHAAVGRLRFPFDLLSSHDMVFWLGDLNYRVNDLSLSETLNLIQTRNFETLGKYDQLQQEMQNGRVFWGFTEGALSFKPTFKYLNGKNTYEKEQLSHTESSASFQSNSNRARQNDLVSEKIPKKLPSWTDRVLWKCHSKTHLELKAYTSVDSLCISDHKPVYALFHTYVRNINDEKFMSLWNSLLRCQDIKANEKTPQISIGQHEHELNFGDFYYYDVRTLNVHVTNEGRISLANLFVYVFDPNAPDLYENVETRFNECMNSTKAIRLMYANLNLSAADSVSTNWLQLNPRHYERLLPGEQTKISIILYLSPKWLRSRLTSRSIELNDNLIFKCLNGNEKFVNVSATYKSTIIGVSLKSLSVLENQADHSLYSLIHSDSFSSLFNTIETQVNLFEAELDTKWKETLRSEIAENETRPSFSYYLRCLTRMRTDIVDSDFYFNKLLCQEYERFLGILIERAQNTHNDTCASTPLNLWDQKNHILICLSKRDLNELKTVCDKIDLTSLVDVLADLLQALPTSLIPTRYQDLCLVLVSSSFFDYAMVRELLDYLPRSYLRLLELVIKFMQALYVNKYKYCVRLSNAMFQFDSRIQPEDGDKQYLAYMFLSRLTGEHNRFITCAH